MQRLGAELVDDLEGADLAILPGVGSARSAMDGLRERGTDDVLRARHAAGHAILGICLGLQLALDESEEDGGVAGLGLVPGRAVRLQGGRVPRIGWAHVEPLASLKATRSSGRATAALHRRFQPAARRTGSRTPTQPRRPRRPPRARASPPSSSRARSPACSSIPRRAAPRVRASWSNASPALDPVPRRGGRARRQGRQVPGPARRRRSRRARRGVFRRGRRRARVPRYLGDGRREERRGRRRSARRRAGDDPVHVRRRHPHAR